MDNKELYEILYHLDILENSFKDKDELATLFQIETTLINDEMILVFNMSSNDIFEISKQPRGLAIPKHIHSYIEICYVFNGTCKHRLNEKEINLKKGDILVLDEKVVHESLAMNTGDIAINILLNKQFITPDLLDSLAPKSLLQEFFLRATSKYSNHANFLVFEHNSEQVKIDHIMEIILTEYYSSVENSKAIISTGICLLLQCLSKQTKLLTNMVPNKKNTRSKVSCNELMDYIKKNYQNCTLKKLGNHFGFNPNYLSNMLKAQTGKSFKEVLTLEKFQHALVLIDETELPISEVMYIVGISNASYFYKKFEEIYGIQLSKYRKRQ
jgi:YesN/AraC family two-component response regulator